MFFRKTIYLKVFGPPGVDTLAYRLVTKFRVGSFHILPKSNP